MSFSFTAAAEAAHASVFEGLFPTHALVIAAARLHLRRRAELTRAIEPGRSPEYIRVAEGREQIAAAALTEALRQVAAESKQP